MWIKIKSDFRLTDNFRSDGSVNAADSSKLREIFALFLWRTSGQTDEFHPENTLFSGNWRKLFLLGNLTLDRYWIDLTKTIFFVWWKKLFREFSLLRVPKKRKITRSITCTLVKNPVISILHPCTQNDVDLSNEIIFGPIYWVRKKEWFFKWANIEQNRLIFHSDLKIATFDFFSKTTKLVIFFLQCFDFSGP